MRKIPIPTEAKHHNQLKGEILKDLISINTVEHINLSYNALTGKTITRIVNSQFT